MLKYNLVLFCLLMKTLEKMITYLNMIKWLDLIIQFFLSKKVIFNLSMFFYFYLPEQILTNNSIIFPFLTDGIPSHTHPL